MRSSVFITSSEQGTRFASNGKEKLSVFCGYRLASQELNCQVGGILALEGILYRFQ